MLNMSRSALGGPVMTGCLIVDLTRFLTCSLVLMGEPNLTAALLDGVALLGTPSPSNAAYNLETILKKSNPPTNKNHFPQSLAPIFQMPIPSKRHENIGNG